MAEEEKKLAVELPGEWMLKKTLGPTFDQIGIDLAGLYKGAKTGVAKIAVAAKDKIPENDTDKIANLRVTRDVFWNGSFSDEAICAEYFGGVLAQWRTEDGKDDSGVFYLDIIKSLSSSQLRLHFLIYKALNQLTASDENINFNPGNVPDLNKLPLFIRTSDLSALGINIDTDVVALYQKDLITTRYSFNNTMHPKGVHVVKVTPSPLGIQLYCVASNALKDWRQFDTMIFDNFQYAESLKHYAFSPEDL